MILLDAAFSREGEKIWREGETLWTETPFAVEIAMFLNVY
jgi:hypothetical protein